MLFGNPLLGATISKDSVRVLLDQSNELAYVQPGLSQAYAIAAYELTREMPDPSLKSEAAQVLGYSYYDQRKLLLARDYFLEALRWSEAAELGELNEKNHHALYQLYRRMEDFENARIHIEKALAHAKSLGIPRRLAVNHRGLGELYRELGIADKGIASLHRAMKVLNQSGQVLDYPLYIDCETSLGLIYKDLEDFDRAREHLQSALLLAEQQELAIQSLYAHLNLGLVVKKLADRHPSPDSLYQLASFHNKTALDLAQKQNRKPETAIVLTNMAFLAFERGKLDLADTLLQRSLSLKEEIGNLRSLGYAYWLKGKLAAANHRSQEAIQCYLQAISFAQQGKDLPLHRNLVDDLSEEYFRTNDLVSYRKSLELKEKLSDSLINLNKAKNIARSEIFFEQDSDFTPLQAQPHGGTASSPGWAQWLLSGLALVCLLLLVYSYYRLRIKEKLIRVVDSQLKESRKRQERLNRQLLAYSERLANTVTKNKELLHQLNQSSAASARQEALEALSRFRISKTEDLRTFRLLFERAFPGYWEGLLKEVPDLTENERMIAALFKLGYTTQEMADVLGISYEGTKKARYRLKKKVATRAGHPELVQLAGMWK
jgi:tetratricopeptide (TPR) repeat protein